MYVKHKHHHHHHHQHQLRSHAHQRQRQLRSHAHKINYMQKKENSMFSIYDPLGIKLLTHLRLQLVI